MSLANYKDWHNPHNEDCPQNWEYSKAGSLDCTCKRKVNRKPFKVIRVHDESVGGHKVPKDIVLEVHPGGLIRLRAKRGKTSFDTTAATIYARLLWAEAMKAAKAKKAARRAK